MSAQQGEVWAVIMLLRIIFSNKKQEYKSEGTKIKPSERERKEEESVLILCRVEKFGVGEKQNIVDNIPAIAC